MKVTIDANSGFCLGVTTAIRKAETNLQISQLFCLGDIVHNEQEVRRLEALGLETIDYDRLRELRGGTILLRAHGEPPATYHIAEANRITIIDATCPVVKKLQERIRNCYEQNVHSGHDGQIVIFGKVGHAEVVGLQGQTNDTAVVIENEDDLTRIDFTRDVYLFSQTTMSVERFQQIRDLIRQRIAPSVHFEWHDTICRNVANRVDKLKEFAREQDLVIFVGGKKSSNAKVLYQHCCEANPNTIFVENADDSSLWPHIRHFQSFATRELRVGICGATSTPLWLMEQVRDKVKNMQ